MKRINSDGFVQMFDYKASFETSELRWHRKSGHIPKDEFIICQEVFNEKEENSIDKGIHTIQRVGLHWAVH